MASGPVLGIDPGTRKCGYAIVAAAGAPPLAIGIEPTESLRARIDALVAEFAPAVIALGAGTNNAVVAETLAGIGVPVRLTDELETTLHARARYFEANPPRGWRRIVPRGMLLPPRPIDDFAAVLIAERFLERGSAQPE